MNILLTGGAGYIGTHLCYQLNKDGHQVIILDNFSNSNKTAIRRCSKLANSRIIMIESDVRDTAMLIFVLREQKIDAVFHLASLKSAPESLIDPVKYYQNNVIGIISLLRAMKQTNVNNLIFSSSAMVYNMLNIQPFSEKGELKSSNAYGNSKIICEKIIEDYAMSNKKFKYISLRYFNPIGAHPSGLMGEDFSFGSTNLMACLCAVAIGKVPFITIYGTTFDTPDKSAIRDFIHISDLCIGHVSALNLLSTMSNISINLGTGVGTGVITLIKMFEQVNKVTIPCRYATRRACDLPVMVADIALAKALLLWQPKNTIENACKTAYQWAYKNPNGYPEK